MISKLISIGEVERLLREENWKVEPFDFSSAFTMVKDWSEDGIGIIHPEGTVKGDFQFPHRVTIVRGDLVIDGNLSDGGWDSQITIILGNCSCANLETRHEIYVLGDLTVKNMIYGSSNSDFMLRVFGNLTATSLIEAGQHFACGKKCFANFAVSFEAGLSGDSGIEINLYFDSGPSLALEAVPEILNAEGDIDKNALKSRALNKLPLVRQR